MRQWPAWGWCWESSCRRIFSFCTRSLLYLGTVRHSASSGNWAGDRACWGPPGATCSFNWVGWLKEVRWSVENRRKGEEHGNRWREGMKEKNSGLSVWPISYLKMFVLRCSFLKANYYCVIVYTKTEEICPVGNSLTPPSTNHRTREFCKKFPLKPSPASLVLKQKVLNRALSSEQI